MKLIFAGDVNLMGVSDPKVPFGRIAPELCSADVLFCNLECCLHPAPPAGAIDDEGFFADPIVGGEALRLAGIHAVGIANNVNYGAANITGSIARLDALGILHTGAGANRKAARAPAIVERNGTRVGILQRSSVYWPTDHAAREHAPGIAVIRGHTAYEAPVGRAHADSPPANRPGVAPIIITWADANDLGEFRKDIEALRGQVDMLVASCHWGLGREPLQYMRDIGRAAIEAGADLVIGHGPHYPMPVEIHRRRTICYGLGSLSFHTGHRGRKHGKWTGLVLEVELERGVKGMNLRLVRNNDADETVFCRLDEAKDTVSDLTARSKELGAILTPVDGERLRIAM
jgi:poly-gamma-glutamate synthesis protein (capsule biosynthesis protein)